MTQTHFTETCREEPLSWAVPGATCDTLCSNRETIPGWSHKSRCLLDAANQWEHQDLEKKKSRASIRQTNHAAWDLCKEKSLCSGLRIGVNQPHTIARGRFTCCVLILLIIAASQPLGADTRAWVRHRVCLRASKVIYTVSSVPGASALSLMQTK